MDRGSDGCGEEGDMRGTLHIFSGVEELVQRAAESITGALETSIMSGGGATVLLAGGNTPARIYESLGHVTRNRVDWRRVHLFWGDERCVAPNMPESNYRMVEHSLLSRIEIPSGNIHRIETEREPSEAARMYEQEITRVFDLVPGVVPSFSLALLGLGEDGHTASLFPGSESLLERQRLAVDTFVAHLNTHRITVTLPVINHASTVMMLVSGKSKSSILREVLDDGPAQYPAQMVKPATGRLDWFIDREAASQLRSGAQV